MGLRWGVRGGWGNVGASEGTMDWVQVVYLGGGTWEGVVE